MTCPLDGGRQAALMPGTKPCLAPRLDLSPVCYVLAEQADVLVVNGAHLVRTEGTRPLASEPVPLLAPGSPPSSVSRV